MLVESIEVTGAENKAQRWSLGLFPVSSRLGVPRTHMCAGSCALPVLKDSSEQLQKKGNPLAPSFGYHRHYQPISQRWKLRFGEGKRLIKVKVHEHLIL